MTDVGVNDAPRSFEIHNSAALLQIAGRTPATPSWHCWIYKPPLAGKLERSIATLAPWKSRLVKVEPINWVCAAWAWVGNNNEVNNAITIANFFNFFSLGIFLFDFYWDK
jgi:hypothetical protein